jgi:hypothetical protein
MPGTVSEPGSPLSTIHTATLLSPVPPAAVHRQQSNPLTVSVTALGSPAATRPDWRLNHRQGKNNSSDTASPRAAEESDLPVSHCCAVQRSFSGSASPASAPASPAHCMHAALREPQAARSAENGDRGLRSHGFTRVPWLPLEDGSMLVSREQCSAALEPAAGVNTLGSDVAELARVQTAVYDGAQLCACKGSSGSLILI